LKVSRLVFRDWREIDYSKSMSTNEFCYVAYLSYNGRQNIDGQYEKDLTEKE